MLHDPWFYAAAIPAMFILGLSKGGFTSAGVLTVPILALAIPPVQAAGITLPILVLSDIIVVVLFCGTFDRPTVKIILSGAVVGILIAWLTAAWVNETEIRVLIGVISVAFALNYWLRHSRNPHPHGHNLPKGLFWGAVAGFTSFVSHAGAPPYQVYTAPLRLEPRLLAGTSVLIFAIMNAIKLVPYFFLGQFNAENLTASLILLPIAIPPTLFGVWLIKRVRVEPFYRILYVVIFVVGLYLIGESIAAYV
ncbi:MAG TPA: sulfite exporter TauE/SafE family protein [Xanthobacteraceae bacterium]|nr:sulfite exporter TauE/SafE family protein [Xanthobacteraceae bacterium]HVY18843.1 sulfite exporter TauE/SafE family protein [Bauldia sp.]